MTKFEAKEISHQELYGLCHPYVVSKEWYIIVTSNELLPEIQFYVEENIPKLDTSKDVIAWEEPYRSGAGGNPFGFLVVMLRKANVTKKKFEKIIRGPVADGNDIIGLKSPYRRDSEKKISQFIGRLSGFMNQSEQLT